MGNRLLAAFMIALSGFYIAAAYRLPTLDIGDPLGPKIFPYIIGGLGIITAVWLLIETAARAREAGGKTVPATSQPAARHHPLAVAAVLAWMLVFYLLIERLGFIVSCTGFLLGLTAYFNRGRWVTNVLVALLFPIGVYVAFTKILGISLPMGMLPL
jgi:putative tricarboxylic transport membrane protein